MNENAIAVVIVAAIGLVQAVTLAILNYILKKVGKVDINTAETRAQIDAEPAQPSGSVRVAHPSLRDENRAQLSEIRGWFTALFNQQNRFERKVKEEFEAVTETLDTLTTGYTQNRGRIELLEDTVETKIERKDYDE